MTQLSSLECGEERGDEPVSSVQSEGDGEEVSGQQNDEIFK